MFVQYQSREWQGALIGCLHRFDNVIDSGWDVTKREETQSSSACSSHQFYCIMFTISCSESFLCLLGVTHLHSHSSVKAVASDSSSATSPSLSVLTVKKTPPDSLVVREVVLDLEAWENVLEMRFLVVWSQWINKNQGEIDSDSKPCWENIQMRPQGLVSIHTVPSNDI